MISQAVNSNGSKNTALGPRQACVTLRDIEFIKCDDADHDQELGGYVNIAGD